MHAGYELVWMAAERTPNQLAIVDDRTERRLTYRELIAEVDMLAAGMSARGIKAGSRVATALPTTFEHCLAVLALMRLNAVPALLNFRLKPEEIAGLCQFCDIEGAVLRDDPVLVETVAAQLPKGAPVWTVGGNIVGAENFADCEGQNDLLRPYKKPADTEAAFLFFTSGTTGLPKAVVLSHRATEHRILWLSTQGGLRQGVHNRALGCMPLSHVIGFYGVFLTSLAFNGTFFVVSEFNPVKVVDLIDREQLTYLFCVPTMFTAMTSAPNYTPNKFSSVELALYGGISIDPDLLKTIDREWGGNVRHIYGTTETMCSLTNPDPVGQHATLRAAYYTRSRLIRINSDGVDDVVAIGEQGELIVDATVDTIFTEYLNNPEATAAKKRDGWYFTGDIFLKEANGDITLVGRVDDMIRSGGESIHPEEVEVVLQEHQAITAVCVVGIPDPKWGQIVVACVQGRTAASLKTAEEIDTYCRGSALARFKRPKAYYFIENLPKNAADKVVRHSLRDIVIAAQADHSADFHLVA